MKWLLDTNVVSEATRPAPAPEVLGWVSQQRLDDLYTHSLVLAEIQAGIARLSDLQRKATLENWLRRKVRPFFGPRVLEADELSWQAMLKMIVQTKANGRTTPVNDLVFASVAKRHDIVLVTRNVRDFAGTGVALLNPWIADPQISIA